MRTRSSPGGSTIESAAPRIASAGPSSNAAGRHASPDPGFGPADVEPPGVEDQARRRRIPALEMQGGRALQDLPGEVHVEVELEMADPDLPGIGEGVDVAGNVGGAHGESLADGRPAVRSTRGKQQTARRGTGAPRD